MHKYNEDSKQSRADVASCTPFSDIILTIIVWRLLSII